MILNQPYHLFGYKEIDTIDLIFYVPKLQSRLFIQFSECSLLRSFAFAAK
mgnify:CR=1 FL=1